MDPMRKMIFENVIKAMQDAEDIGGPEGDNYIGLMEDIGREAYKRIFVYMDQRIQAAERAARHQGALPPAMGDMIEDENE